MMKMRFVAGLLGLFLACVCAMDALAQGCVGWAFVGNHSGAGTRRNTAFTYDAQHGVAVLYGGNTSFSGDSSATWEWNGVSWAVRPTSQVGRPTQIVELQMVYDSVRSVSVLFGGEGFDANGMGFRTNELWEYDGNTWALRANTGPAARDKHAMAYDSARGVTVVHGGLGLLPDGTFGRFDDTWEWNGTTWTQQLATGPGTLSSSAMAFDALRGVVVLFGGIKNSAGSLTPSGETWEWNGTTWTQIATSGPAARANHTMSYDSAHGVVVLYGGSSTSSVFHDTWTWDGTTWRQIAPSGPNAWSDMRMAYDSSRNRNVLVGGVGCSSWDCDETWELDLNSNDLTFTSQPNSLTIQYGTIATFATAATSGDTISYQWRRNGVNLVDDGRISGATTSILTINPAGLPDQGTYDVVATNNCGSVVSNSAALTILCKFDLNDDGAIDVLDYFEFVAGFAQGCM